MQGLVSQNGSAYFIPTEAGVDTNDISDTDDDDGYNNKATQDFNLKADRTYNGDGNDTIPMGIGS